MLYRLREYRQGDESIVLSILEESLAAYGLVSDASGVDSDIVNIKESYLNSGGTFKILLKKKKPIGTYGLFKVSSEACELRKMYLSPAHKGMGLGKLMMEDCFKEARIRRFAKIVLETNSSLVEAISLYKKYGFREYKPPHLSDRCDIGMQVSI
jgi:GNAT superfamily N-acetyltransferase